MPSSGYIANSFVAGEQPSTAVWNELWGNDASFNSGAGFNDGIIQARHFQSGGIGTYTNTGNGGGQGQYLNIGGMKECWGQTGAFTSVAGNNYTISLPSGFFSTVEMAKVEPFNPTNVPTNLVVNAYSTSSVTVYVNTTNTNMQFAYIVRGS